MLCFLERGVRNAHSADTSIQQQISGIAYIEVLFRIDRGSLIEHDASDSQCDLTSADPAMSSKFIDKIHRTIGHSRRRLIEGRLGAGMCHQRFGGEGCEGGSRTYSSPAIRRSEHTVSRD